MKNILIFFLFLQIIKISIQIIPFWNFSSSAIDLLNNNEQKHTYIKYSSDLHNVPMKLERIISKENEQIKIINKLYINDTYYGETEFDDIESHYQNNKGNYLICPKGKYHMYLYYKENKTFTILKPDGFPNIDNWNLIFMKKLLELVKIFMKEFMLLNGKLLNMEMMHQKFKCLQ